MNIYWTSNVVLIKNKNLIPIKEWENLKNVIFSVSIFKNITINYLFFKRSFIKKKIKL